MAGRNNTTQSERTKKLIRSTQLLKRIQDNALADEEFMTPSQVQCAKICIGKVVPDLKAIEVETINPTPIQVQIVKFGDTDTLESSGD
jgi:hypothetical protein